MPYLYEKHWYKEMDEIQVVAYYTPAQERTMGLICLLMRFGSHCLKSYNQLWIVGIECRALPPAVVYTEW